MKIAVIAHIFYREIFPEIAVCIDNFIGECGRDSVEVFATYPEVKPELRQLVEMLACAVHVEAVPNRGYDVGPFFQVLDRLDLDAYDYVVKLHTKRDVPFCVVNFHIMRGGEWRRELLSFCSSRKAVAASLKAFMRDETRGMIAGRKVIDPSGVGMFSGVEGCRSVLGQCGVVADDTTVVCGTMFMVRAKLLKPVQGKVSLDDFPKVDRCLAHVDLGRARDWEGAFAMLVRAQNCRVAFGRGPKVSSRGFYLMKKVTFMLLRRILTPLRGLVGAIARHLERGAE